MIDLSATIDNRNLRGDKARSWKTTYTVHGRNKVAEDEKERERKENTAKALSLAIPRVGRGSIASNTPKQRIDLMPRRKTEMGCKSTIEETLLKKRLYRPPHTRNTSSDEEKNRLQQIMMDGKGLASDSSAARSNATIECEKSNEIRPAAATLVDQLVCEIIEREKHQIAMEEIGAGDATRESTALDIKRRLEHLKRLDPHLASAVLQKLTS
jgi:hypothetical protein